MFAVRNIKLCTKDCMCLYVCPTGATDTENGKIDESKCIDGCRLCVDACPSNAIYLVYDRYPENIIPENAVLGVLAELLVKKADMFTKLQVIAENESLDNRDADKITLFLCEDCGYISTKSTPKKCPNCSSDKLFSVE